MSARLRVPQTRPNHRFMRDLHLKKGDRGIKLYFKLVSVIAKKEIHLQLQRTLVTVTDARSDITVQPWLFNELLHVAMQGRLILSGPFTGEERD